MIYCCSHHPKRGKKRARGSICDFAHFALWAVAGASAALLADEFASFGEAVLLRVDLVESLLQLLASEFLL